MSQPAVARRSTRAAGTCSPAPGLSPARGPSQDRPTAPSTAAALSRRGPANGEPVQRVAARIDRGLNKVVSDGLHCLRLSGRDQLPRNLRSVPGLVEGNALGLRIQHGTRRLRPQRPTAAEAPARPAVLPAYRLGARVGGVARA